MPASADPQKHARQLANLQPNASRKHGAHSDEVTGPSADRHYKRLRKLLPGADNELLQIQGRRAAQMEFLQDWIARNGLLKRSPKGDVFGAVTWHERVASSFERLHLVLLEREREREHQARRIDQAGVVIEVVPDADRRDEVLRILADAYEGDGNGGS